MTERSGATDVQQFERGEAPLDDDDLLAAYATDPDRPWLRVNFVTSLDGAVTAATGTPPGSPARPTSGSSACCG